MLVSPAAANPPPQRRAPRYYIHRVLDPREPLTAVIPGAYPDLITAWGMAAELRRQRPKVIFIAGEMCSTR